MTRRPGAKILSLDLFVRRRAACLHDDLHRWTEAQRRTARLGCWVGIGKFEDTVVSLCLKWCRPLLLSYDRSLILPDVLSWSNSSPDLVTLLCLVNAGLQLVRLCDEIIHTGGCIRPLYELFNKPFLLASLCQRRFHYRHQHLSATVWRIHHNTETKHAWSPQLRFFPTQTKVFQGFYRLYLSLK